jgi:hypothetical protein
MLYSRAYNEGMTDDMRTAYQGKDREALHAMIKQLCAELVELDPKDAQYELTASRLQISLALLNSICRRGETVAFINDVVNF